MTLQQDMAPAAGTPTPPASGRNPAAQRHNGMPAFFNDAPTLTVRDPLAAFLGAAEDGVIEYTYADAVRLAGHSCPTVAGAYLMTLRGLRALYGDALPERGNVEVSMRDQADSGTTGVIAAVVQLLTGAARETGFHGIGPGGRFSRQDLLRFDQPVSGTFALRRRDTGQAVQVELDASVVPWPDEMRSLLPRVVVGSPTPEEERRFGELWQQRVQRMLLEHADDPEMVAISEWTEAG